MTDALTLSHVDDVAERRATRPAPSLTVDILGGHPLFQSLTGGELEKLVNMGRAHRKQRGDRIFSKGEAGGALYVVLSGAIRLSSTARSGAEIVHNVIQTGELFGEISFLDGQPRTANATAVAETELLSIDRRDFLPLASEHPELAMRLVAVVCDRMRRACPQVEDAMFLDTPARLANTILRHAQPNGGLELRLRATQKQLGDMIGLSRESTNKQLQIWVRKSWIEIEKGGIVVRDPAALSSAARVQRS